MSSPIIVNGSTTIISVRAKDFTYDSGATAVVILSSINNLNQMVTIFDEDGYVGGPTNRKIRISTSKDVYFDSGINPILGGGDYRKEITVKGQSLSVYPRTLNQWVLTQTVISSDINNTTDGVTVSGTDFSALQSQIVNISTNLVVYGSTISGSLFTVNSRVITSLGQDSLVVDGIQAIQTSTGAVTIGAIILDYSGSVDLRTDNLFGSDNIQASSISTFQHTVSTLNTFSLGLIDTVNKTPSIFRLSSGNTLFNGSNIPYYTASTLSSALLVYSTSLEVLTIAPGLSSISSFISPAMSSIVGADTLSSYSTTIINVIKSIDYGPGVSSLSTIISRGLSSLVVRPAVSTLSTVISLGLSSVHEAPGISSLYYLFSEGISTVASGTPLSTLSTAISLGLSTVNATLAFQTVSTMYSYGVSDISLHTGLSSLSTLIPLTISSLVFKEGVSSISSYIFSSLSSLAVGPGLSSLSTSMSLLYSGLTSPIGLSSLSIVLFTNMSTQDVSIGMSTLSTTIARGLSSVSVGDQLSSISTTTAAGLFNVLSKEGISSLSTLIPLTLSSIDSSSGASSLFLFIKNQFSTLSDQDGISSLSSVVSFQLSSIVRPGASVIQYPALLSTLNIVTSTLSLWDSTLSIYTKLYLSANQLYIKNNNNSILIDTFVVQSTSRSTISISTLNINIGGLLEASTINTPLLHIDYTNNTSVSTLARTVSAISLTTSSLVISSINFLNTTTPPLALYMSNRVLYFNNSSISYLNAPGASSFSTTLFSGVSSLSQIYPLSFSNTSTAFPYGVSSLNIGPGLSSLSTSISFAAPVYFYPGVSTNFFYASTALISTISSFGPLNSVLNVSNLVNSKVIITSSVFACNVNIENLNLPIAFVSSFNFNKNTSFGVSTVSTIITGAGLSTGNVFIHSSNASTLASNVLINAMYVSSIYASTLYIPNIGGSNISLNISIGTIFVGSNDITAVGGDPNNLTAFITTLTTGSIYTSTLIVSSFMNPITVKVKDPVIMNESIEVTQSSLSLFNRTKIDYDNLLDVIEYSSDGINWSATNWSQESFGIQFIFSKPCYNGVYWLVGNFKNAETSNSIIYSADGIKYYPLENDQFYFQAYNPKWNGSYWLAGDVYNGDPGQPTNTIMRSIDGLIWTAATSGGFGASAINFGWNGYIWVAVGYGSGMDINEDPVVTSNIQYSRDGFDWINGNGVMPQLQANCVIFDGSKWIVGGQGTISVVYSYDGITWLDSTLNDDNIVYDIVYNGNIYVAGGQFLDGTYGLMNSYDGINWTYVTQQFLTTDGLNTFIIFAKGITADIQPDIPYPYGCISVTWSGEKFVAAGASDTASINIQKSPAGAYSYDGLTWVLTDTAASATCSGQGVGFSSNVLPNIETTTLSIYSMSKGFIPLFMTSTNHWQVCPSSIIMNNGFTINKEPGSDKRVGINTAYPTATLDINGTLTARTPTSFSSIVIGSSINYIPTMEASIFGSTMMNSLVIGASNTTRRFGPLDVNSRNNPIINRGAYLNISSFSRMLTPITSTLVTINQVATFPQTGNELGDDGSIYWVWNNGPGTTQQSSLYFSLPGTPVPFTGQHACYVSSVSYENISSHVGLIVSSEDKGYVSVDMNGNVTTGKDAIWSTESLPYVNLTSSDMDKGVFGVISDVENLPIAIDPQFNNNAYKIHNGYKNSLFGRILINGIGDGAVWTTNINGNVNPGDYLCSSVIPGHARVQDDSSSMFNYTVAKATISCDFNLESSQYRCEPIEWNGSTFIRAFVGVTYHCG